MTDNARMQTFMKKEFSILNFLNLFSKVCVVESQLGNRQPCLVCGESVLRIWSLMSRRGDRYLRITDNNSINNHKIIDCAGGLQSDNHTSKS